jgi:hypothetical protein
MRHSFSFEDEGKYYRAEFDTSSSWITIDHFLSQEARDKNHWHDFISRTVANGMMEWHEDLDGQEGIDSQFLSANGRQLVNDWLKRLYAVRLFW